jgi:Tfp pilus assembly protein PilF
VSDEEDRRPQARLRATDQRRHAALRELAAGDIEAGLSGLDYVLELDPGYLDAYVNRAGVRAELGDLDGARRDADAGLVLDPDNPHLHCVRGQLHAEDGRDGDARPWAAGRRP